MHVSLIVFCLYVYILSRFHSSSFVLLFPTFMCDFASLFFLAICICVFMRNEDETRIRVMNLLKWTLTWVDAMVFFFFVLDSSLVWGITPH